MNRNLLALKKFEPEKEDLLYEVLDGFGKSQKQLPCKLFYDKRGSALFDQICELEEYYPTRTEISIMENNIDAFWLGRNEWLLGSSLPQCFYPSFIETIQIPDKIKWKKNPNYKQKWIWLEERYLLMKGSTRNWKNL